MLPLPFDPRVEKDALVTALSVLRARRAQNREGEAVGALRAAIARAEEMYAALTPHASQSERELVRRFCREFSLAGFSVKFCP
jgi:hypothetical protein